MTMRPSDKVLFTTMYVTFGYFYIPAVMMILSAANVISWHVLEEWMYPIFGIAYATFFFGLGITVMLTRGEPRRKSYYYEKGVKKKYIDWL